MSASDDDVIDIPGPRVTLRYPNAVGRPVTVWLDLSSGAERVVQKEADPPQNPYRSTPAYSMSADPEAAWNEGFATGRRAALAATGPRPDTEAHAERWQWSNPDGAWIVAVDEHGSISVGDEDQHVTTVSCDVRLDRDAIRRTIVAALAAGASGERTPDDEAAWFFCPQHGPFCGGDGCCCADQHHAEVPGSGGERSTGPAPTAVEVPRRVVAVGWEGRAALLRSHMAHCADPSCVCRVPVPDSTDPKETS